jgi:hypothetical protein
MKYCGYYLVSLLDTTSDRIEDVPHEGPYCRSSDAFAAGNTNRLQKRRAFIVRYVASDGYMYINKP